MKTTLTTREKINYLKSLPEYATGRLEQINKKINNTDNIQLHVILQIGIAVNHYFKSLIASLETQNINASNILFRSFIESVINVEYIMRDDSQKRSVAFIFEDFKIRKINVETIKNLIRNKKADSQLNPRLSTIKKCNEQLKKIKNDEKNILTNLKNNFGIEIEEEDLIIPPVEQRANLAKLKDLYDILYRQLCQLTHLSSSGLKTLIEFNNNKYKIVPIDIEEETKRIIPIAYDIYLLTIENILKKFGLYVKEDFIVMEDISKKIKN